MSYYTILDIIPTASMDEIKDAYLKKIDDVDLEDERNFLNKAYETLSDYNSRRKYDKVLEEDNNDDVKAYNNENHDNCFEVEADDNFNDNFTDNFNDNYNDNFLEKNDLDVPELLKKLNEQMSSIVFRLENIEKRLYTKDINNNNFFSERKHIKEKYSTNGKKVVEIGINRNNNGKKSFRTKTIDYDSDGNQNITTKIPPKNI